jgi:hypothetical protein
MIFREHRTSGTNFPSFLHMPESAFNSFVAGLWKVDKDQFSRILWDRGPANNHWFGLPGIVSGTILLNCPITAPALWAPFRRLGGREVFGRSGLLTFFEEDLAGAVLRCGAI